MTQLLPRARRVLSYTDFDRLLGAGEVRIMCRDLGASETADGGGLAPDRVFAGRTDLDDNLVGTGNGCRTGGLIGRYADPSIGNEIDSLAAAKTRSSMHRDRNVTIQIGQRLDCLPRRGNCLLQVRCVSRRGRAQVGKRGVGGAPDGVGVRRVTCHTCGYLSDVRDGPNRLVTVLDPPLTDRSDPGVWIECTAVLPTPCAAGSI